MRAPSGMSVPARPVGVAAAVPALVARAHELGDGAQRDGGAEDALADERVAGDERPLVGVELPGLVEDRAGDGDLADVVELRRLADVVELLAGEAELLRNRLGQQ